MIATVFSELYLLLLLRFHNRVYCLSALCEKSLRKRVEFNLNNRDGNKVLGASLWMVVAGC